MQRYVLYYLSLTNLSSTQPICPISYFLTSRKNRRLIISLALKTPFVTNTGFPWIRTHRVVVVRELAVALIIFFHMQTFLLFLKNKTTVKIKIN